MLKTLKEAGRSSLTRLQPYLPLLLAVAIVCGACLVGVPAHAQTTGVQGDATTGWYINPADFGMVIDVVNMGKKFIAYLALIVVALLGLAIVIKVVSMIWRFMAGSAASGR